VGRLAPCGERDGSGDLIAQYIWGAGIDELVAIHRVAAVGGYGADTTFYAHQDDQGSVVFITDDAGDVVEHYEYDPFGRPTIYDGEGTTPLAESKIGNRFLFTGREWDAEAGLYYYRLRYYDPDLGAFISRDPLGTWGDPLNGGNGSLYVGHAPGTWVDPWGLYSWYTDPEVWGSFGGGCRGGASIVSSTLSFGGTDAIGLTNSDQYAGPEYTVSRVSSTVSREALLFAATAGMSTAAQGGSAVARYGLTGVTAVDLATGAHSVGSGAGYISEGEYVRGGFELGAGALGLAGGGLGARQGLETVAEGIDSIADAASGGARGLAGRNRGMVYIPDFPSFGVIPKKIPNPYGRTGGPAHQAGVARAEAELSAQGLIVVREYHVPTPGGQKGSRFADVAGLDPPTRSPVKVINVGDQVKREFVARDDLQEALGPSCTVEIRPKG